MNKLVSDQYTKQLTRLHQIRESFGDSGSYKHIDEWLANNKCHSLLDYGCGKGNVFKNIQKKFPLIDCRGYDPGVPEYAVMPEIPAELVICTDVLEHIAEQDIDYVLTQILSRSNKVVFLNISCRPAVKHFKEGKFKGKNVHISIFDPSWWGHKIGNIWNNFNHLKIYTLCDTKEGTHATCIKKEKE